MIERSADAWEHNQFKDVIVRAANVEMCVLSSIECFNIYLSSHSYYRALSFYLEEHPTLLTDLLTVLTPRINHARVVRMFRKQDHLPLIRNYLIAVQEVSRMNYITLVLIIFQYS
jgi:clathrin heavy chain